MKSHNFFSLLELLVVISIIGILISILIPSLRKAREVGRLAVCLSNLRQVSVASTVYGTNEDNSLPIYESGSTGNHGRWGKDRMGLERALASVLQSSVPTGGHLPTGNPVFMCPSAPLRYNQTTSKYEWQGAAGINDGYSENSYEGLYFHYTRSTVNTVPLNPPIPGILKRTSYSNPSKHPFQWCSRRLTPVWTELGPNPGNNTLAGASFHARGDYAPRPTVFLDSHAKVIKSIKYTRQGALDILIDVKTPHELVKHALSEY